MILSRLRIENFLCIKEASFLVPPSCLTLVVGHNEDSSGVSSNEAGKSSLLHAISWALIGTFPGMRDVDSVILRGTTEAKVFLEGELDSGRRLTVVRTRTQKSGGLKVLVDGDPVADSSRVADVQVALLSLLSLPPRQADAAQAFFNRAYIVPDLFDTFPKAQPAERMRLLTKFLNLDVWDKALAFAREDLRETKSREKGLEEASNLLDLDSLEEKKKDLGSKLFEWQKEIERLVALIKNTEDELKEAQETLRLVGVLERLEKLGVTVEALKEDFGPSDLWENALVRVQAMLRQLDEDRRSKEFELRKVDEALSSLRSSAPEARKCPSCGASLTVGLKGELSLYDEEGVRRHLEEESNRLEKSRSDLLASLKKIDERIASNEKELAEVQRVLDLVKVKEAFKDQVDSLTLAAEISPDAARSRIKELEYSYSSLTHRLESLKEESNRAQATLEEIDKQLLRASEIKEELASARKKGKVLDSVVRSFPKIRSELVRRFIPLLEAKTNQYLSDLGVDLFVRFEFSQGRGTPALNVSVEDLLGGRWDFGQRSLGMQARISACIAFAFADLARQEREALPLMCDEVVDQLDEVGVELFFRLLQGWGGQRFVISHSSAFAERFDNRIVVEKKNGVSEARWRT